jgi:hypothetical protein
MTQRTTQLGWTRGAFGPLLLSLAATLSCSSAKSTNSSPLADAGLLDATTGCTGAACGAGGASGDGGPGAASGDAGSDGGPAMVDGDAGLGSCGPLASRVTFTTVSVAPATVSSGVPIMVATLADGTSQVAWSETTLVHVTPLDANQQRRAADTTVTGSEVRGFVALPESDAMLVVRNDEMVLVSVGTTAFETVIVGGEPHTTDGGIWVDSWGHEGRLLWDGSIYYAYFGCSENWGSIGSHQQDYLWTLTAAGAIVNPPGQYDWICGHSLDLRLGLSGTAPTTDCLSDCNYDLSSNPNPGIYVNSNRVFTVTGDCAGDANALLGGMVTQAGGSYVSFAAPNGGTSDDGGANYDVGMMFVPKSGTPGAVEWVTSTPAIQETAVHLGAYGANLLAAWDAGGTTELAIVSPSGAIVEGPIDIAAQFSDGDDFVSFPDGDVGWAGAWGSRDQLQVMRVRYCP